MNEVEKPQIGSGGRFGNSRTLGRYQEPARGGRRKVVGFASVLALAMLLVYLLHRVAPGPGDIDQAAAEPTITGAPSSVGRFEPPPLAALRSAPLRLAWPSQPQARQVRVRIYDETMEPLWESEWLPNTAREIALPEEVVERLVPGRRFGWRVFLDVGTGEDSALTFGEFEILP